MPLTLSCPVAARARVRPLRPQRDANRPRGSSKGSPERLALLGDSATIQLLSADTFGTLAETAAALNLEPRRIGDGEDKRRVVDELDPSACAAVGNGLNDVPMLEAAALAIAVVGPEGASARTLVAADIVCRSIIEAFDLLLDDRALVATLRP